MAQDRGPVTVTIDRADLIRGLQGVHPIVPSRPTLPALAGVLLDAEGEALRLSATDLEVAVRVSVPAAISGTGAVVLAAPTLLDLVQRVPAGPITLQITATGVTIRWAGGHSRMVGIAADEFPAMTPAAPPGWLTLEGKTLREMLAQTSFAVSHEESRPVFNGILFVLQPKELRLVATDGHRLAVSTRAVGQGLSGVSGIVPRKAATEIMRVLGAGEDVQIALTDTQFLLQMPNVGMTARLIEGQFPTYEVVMPREHPGRLAVRRTALMGALRRVSVMAEEYTRLVGLTLKPGSSLTLRAASPDVGEAEETLDATYTGPEMTIGFNARYLLDALGPMEQEEIVVELKDPLSPGVIRGQQDDGYACLVMPIRLGLR